MRWTVYLAGEIHSDWRERIAALARQASLPIDFVGPVADHDASDAVGARILGEEADAFWRDHKGAGVNAIRARGLLRRADIVIVRFGEKYRQWNAAFDAGRAVEAGRPLITIHPPEHDHALKEIDAAACAVCREPEQAVRILEYVTNQG